MSTDAARLNYSDPSVKMDPFPVYASMQATAPVVRSEELGGLAIVTGFADVMQVLKDTETFSSGVIGRGSDRESVRRVLAEGFDDPPMLVTADGTVHEFHAGLVKPYFHPARIRTLADPIRDIANSLCDSIEPGEVDFIHQYAKGLSIRVLAHVIGSRVEQESINLIYHGAEANAALTGAGPGALSEEQELAYARAYVAFQHHIADLIKARQREPSDDFISEIAHAPTPPGQEPLTFPELVALAVLVIGAGNETTRSWMGSAMLHIASDQELQHRLRNEPTILKTVLEESLRHDSPVMLLYRLVTKDTEVGGAPISKGEYVGVAFGAANHDPAQFECPHAFDPDRRARGHMAFGYGAHFCVGAPLARLEAETGLRTFLDRFGSIQLSDQHPYEYVPFPITRTLATLPLQVTR
jgi:cytochrome P450